MDVGKGREQERKLLSANRGHLFHDELVGLETLECLYLFRQPNQHQQLIQFDAQRQ